MSNNMNVLVVGAGMMAGEYCKVIKALSYNPIVIGRGEDNMKKHIKYKMYCYSSWSRRRRIN